MSIPKLSNYPYLPYHHFPFNTRVLIPQDKGAVHASGTNKLKQRCTDNNNINISFPGL